MPPPVGQLASLPPLPSGGFGLAGGFYPPEITDCVVDLKDNPRGEQITSESVQIRAVTITSAQLLALKGNDILIVEPPLAGYSIVVQSISLRLNFGGAAYTLNAGTLIPYLGPSANAVPLTADLSAILTAAATSENIGIPALATGVITQAKAEAQGVFLGNQGAAQYTLGNGTLDVIVAFLYVQV